MHFYLSDDKLLQGLPMRQYEFDEWCEVNAQELSCIFAESGADREIYFDREQASEDIFNAEQYFTLLEWEE
mgnify:FL=1